ncbi:hypothetical protein Y032_0079g1271 [Ancylostoma ceylanicum]|nr:hypothetical protein Y032_0079g1271 [Ancylostoma ceylanicum]
MTFSGTGFEYKFYCDQGKISFEEAERRCQRYKAHLVSIHSEEENRFVLNLIDYGQLDYTWIGLIQERFNDWSWTDGSNPRYEKFYTFVGMGFPKYNTRACVTMNTGIKAARKNKLIMHGKWLAFKCDARHYFVCKRRSS